MSRKVICWISGRATNDQPKRRERRESRVSGVWCMAHLLPLSSQLSAGELGTSLGTGNVPKETGNKSKLRSIPLGTGLVQRLNRTKMNPLFRKCQVT